MCMYIQQIKRTPFHTYHQSGKTPLMRAAMRGHADIVDMLLRHKADPNIQDAVDAEVWPQSRSKSQSWPQSRLFRLNMITRNAYLSTSRVGMFNDTQDILHHKLKHRHIHYNS